MKNVRDLKDAYENKNVMVTGGLGFIGSNLSRQLVELGAKVLIVDSLVPWQGGDLFNIHEFRDKVRVNFSDIRNKQAMNQLVQGQDFIFNLAAQTSHVGSMEDPFVDLDINCRGHLTLLEACKNFNPKVKITYTGTRSQYGKIKYLPVDENHPLNPTDTNGITKLAGEQYHLLYHNAYGLKSVSLRLTNTFGPRQLMKHAGLCFVSWFIRLAMDGETITIFGDGTQKRDLNYVDDVVSAILLVAADDASYGRVFNVGSGVGITIKELTDLIISVAGIGSVNFVPYPEERKAIEIGDYIADITKIKELGWSPRIELEEGLKRTIRFYEKYKDNYWN